MAQRSKAMRSVIRRAPSSLEGLSGKDWKAQFARQACRVPREEPALAGELRLATSPRTADLLGRGPNPLSITSSVNQ
jgi:hypothetical protein